MLLSLSRLRSSFLASCLSVFVGLLWDPCDPITAVAREPAVVRLGLLYEPTIDTPNEFPAVPGRIVDSSESDSSPLHSSSIGLSGSSSGSSSRSLAIAASAAGESENLEEWLRVYHSRPGLIGLEDALGDDISVSGAVQEGRTTYRPGESHRIAGGTVGMIYIEITRTIKGESHLQKFAMIK